MQDGPSAPHEQRLCERGGKYQPPRRCLDTRQGRRLLVKGNVVRVHARRRRWGSIRHDVCAPGKVASRSVDVYPMYPALARRVRRGGRVWIGHQHCVEVACGGGISASCVSCAWNMPGSLRHVTDPCCSRAKGIARFDVRWMESEGASEGGFGEREGSAARTADANGFSCAWFSCKFRSSTSSRWAQMHHFDFKLPC